MKSNRTAEAETIKEPPEELTKNLERLASILIANQWTITAAESCTGGGIASAFTSLAGSSAWFEQSWVTYSNKAKSSLLDVPNLVLEQFGAVSAQTVEAMAIGAACKADAEIAIAVSGIAGPGGGSAEKPVGLVWFGIRIQKQVFSQSMVFEGDRHSVRVQAITYGLQLLNQSLVAPVS